MAFARPAAVGSSERIKRRLVELGAAMGEETWQVETAAMFTQMGSLLLPPDVAERHYAGRSLQEHDRALVARMPLMAADLLGEIPRLEEVAAVLRACPAAGPGDPWGARALHAVLELDDLEVRGASGAEAIAVLRDPPGRHDAEILAHLQRLVVGRRVDGGGGGGYRAAPLGPGTRPVAPRELRAGMILAADVVDSLGRTLLARGIEITPGLERRIAEIEDHIDLGGPVRVHFIPAA